MNLIQTYYERTIAGPMKKKIASLFSLLMVFGMVGGSLSGVMAATSANTSLEANLVAGNLNISAISAVNMGNTNAGANATLTTNSAWVNFEDFRGTGAGYNITANMTNFTAGTNTIDVQPSNRFYVNTGEATLTPNNGASNTGITRYNNVAINGTAATVLAASTNNGLGSFSLSNIPLKLIIDANDKAGQYAATLTWTIS